MDKLKTLLSFIKYLLGGALGVILLLMLIYFITNPNFLGLGTNPDSPVVPISTFKFN